MNYLSYLTLALVLCALLAGGGALGCGGADGTMCGSQPLCDGSDGATYYAALFAGQPAPVPGGELFGQNGLGQAVDGHCRFWIREGASLRTGRLDQGEAEQLVQLGGLDCMERLAGEHAEPGLCDGDLQVLEFHGVRATAANGCGESAGSPEIAREIRSRAADVRAFLAERGAPFDGPVRYWLSLETDPALIPVCYSSPRGWPINAPVDEGMFLADGSNAATLRALAAEVLEEHLQQDLLLACGYIVPIQLEDDMLWRLIVRDAAPIEDPNGVISTQ